MATRQSGRHSNCIDPTQMVPGPNKNPTESSLTSSCDAHSRSDVRRRVHKLLVLLGVLFCIASGPHLTARGAHEKRTHFVQLQR